MYAIVGLIFIGIVASLGSGLYYMASPGARPAADSMARALTVRISLSLGLFILLNLLWLAGVIEPHGIGR